jgi:hypothetical protein
MQQKKTSVDAPAPAPRRTEGGVPPEKLAAKLLQLAAGQGGATKKKGGDDDDAVKKPGRGRPSGSGKKVGGKENAATAEKARVKSTTKALAKTPASNGPAAPANTAHKGTGNGAKTTTTGKKPAAGAGTGGAGAKSTVSRKVAAMAKAAAIATDGLKRPAHHFAVDEEPSDHGSLLKHEGGRPAKRQARAVLHSRFEAAAMAGAGTPGAAADTPGDIVTVDDDEHHHRHRQRAAAHSPRGGSPSPMLALPKPAAQHPSKKSSKKAAAAAAAGGGGGRYAQFAHAAAAAAAGSKHAVGSQGEKLPAGARDGAWSSAYRTLQAAHIKLQTKYDKLKDTKLAGLIDEADTYRMELAEHGSKAEELINHFRGEAQRQREAAAGAEGAGARVYELERENSELKEALLAYQGKILRMEQEAATQHQQRLERAAAEASAGASGRGGDGASGSGAAAGAWGSDELEAFTGFSWAKQATGIHHFCHAATGFTFQLSAADPDAYDDDEDDHYQQQRRDGGGNGDVMSGGGEPADEVSFVPLEFGDAEGYLPGYLSEAIEFERCEMSAFVGRMLGVLNQVAAENKERR